MENWSDSPAENFKLKFFLDTNILAFLIDGTYSGLNYTLDVFKKSDFIYLISSRYVIYEFIGIRKREHYLRKVIDSYTADSGIVNISSLLKYKDTFSAPEVEFSSVQADIQTNVERELDEITNNFGISYSFNLLHDDLLKPTFEICLGSKISKEDSLVLTSSLLPDAAKPEKYISLLSKDQQFTQAFTEFNIEDILANNSLYKPTVEWINRISIASGQHVNLTNKHDDSRLPEFLPVKLLELIIAKNESLYLGETFTPVGAGFPKNVLCFKIVLDKELPNEIFVTIVASDLSFIYTTKTRIVEFRLNNAIIVHPFTASDPAQTNIAFKVVEENGEDIPEGIMARLREEHNKVFIHPDSFI